MKAVKFASAGTGVERHLSLADLDSLGIKYSDSQAGLVWSDHNDHTIVMSNEMSDSLVEALPGEFVVSDPDEEDEPRQAKKSMTVDTSGTSGPPDGSPKGSKES
jgi:hypothetical protein